jgi:NAD(P)-dependent dehydrogenase (short-subunit alcohol dehydrogenase family)
MSKGLELFNMKDRVVVITGAVGGIGTGIAQHLFDMGATLVLADIKESVHEHAKQFNADSIVFDVRNSKEIEEAAKKIMERHGRIDGLVANAGIADDQPSLQTTDEQWRKIMSVNMDGVFYTIRTFARYMVECGRGSIVGISSIAGYKAGDPEVHISYDVTKAGVSHLCSMLAVEWAKTGVRVNSVAPGYTDTELLNIVGRQNPEIMATWMNRVPLGRLITPTEVAATVSFLLADASSGITGQTILVDGAYTKF